MGLLTDKQIEGLMRRVEIIERALGPEVLTRAEGEILFDHEAECAAGNHVDERIAYDLQGGKWGTERCIHCKREYTWHV